MEINNRKTSQTTGLIYAMLQDVSIEQPLRTEAIIKATGLNIRNIRRVMQDLIFYYGVPVGSTRQGQVKGYFLITNEEELSAALRPLFSQAREELYRISKLKENYYNMQGVNNNEVE